MMMKIGLSSVRFVGLVVMIGFAFTINTQAATEPDKTINAASPKNILSYVQKVQLGDKYGALSLSDLNNDQNTLFIHPGVTTPTSFKFDTLGFMQDHATQRTVKISGAMAPNISSEAMQRSSAANVKLTILKQGKTFSQALVKVGAPYSIDITLSKKDQLEFIVDNNGDPDTDWFLLTIN